MKYIRALTVLAIGLLVLFQANAIEIKVFAVGTDNFNDMSYSGSAQNQQGAFTIKLIASCFRAKQKPVFNPISGTGTIGFQLGIAGLDYSVSFPAWITRPLDGTGENDSAIIDLTLPPRLYSVATVESAYATRNLVLIRSKENPSITVVDALGNYASADRVNQISYILFQYDQVGGTSCPPPPAPQPSWCSIYSMNEKNNFEHFVAKKTEQIAHFSARYFMRPLSLLMANFAEASIPIYGLPADPAFMQPDFDAANWGNPVPYDARYTAQDGPIGAMLRVNYSSDLKQLEINAVFPSYDTNCGSYF